MKNLFYAFLFLSALVCHGQDRASFEVDSLQKLLQKASSDTEQLRYQVELLYYNESNPIELLDSFINECQKNNLVKIEGHLYTQKAAASMVELNVQSIDDLYKKALHCYRQVDYNNGIVEVYSNRATTLFYKGDIEGCNHYFDTTAQIIEEFEVANWSKAHYKLSKGMVYFMLGQYMESRTELHAVTKLLKDLNDYGHLEMKIIAYNLLGQILFIHKMNEMGREMIDSAIVFSDRQGSECMNVLMLNNSIGAMYIKEKNYRKGLDYYIKAFQMGDCINFPIIKQILNSNIALAYANIGQFDSSQYYLDRVDLEALPKNAMNMDRISANMSMIHSFLGNSKEALYYANEMKRLMKDTSHFAALNHVFSKAHETNGDYKKAFHHLKEYYKYHQKEIDAGFEKKILAKEWDLKLEKKEAIFAETHKRQRQVILTFAVGGLGLIVVLFLVLRMFKQKKKAFEVIDKQKKEVERQRDIVKLKNEEILSSIEYAKRIQTAILPPSKLVKEYHEETFIYFRPKDIVSGDFYWFETMQETIYFAAADCTGHGVPGAMVSVICSNALNKSVKELGNKKPSDILDSAAKIVEERLDEGAGGVQDGMDIAFCKLNKATKILEYAGAHNPLWIIRKGNQPIDNANLSLELDGISIYEVKADPQPIGKYFARESFNNHTLQLEEGDTLYVFSDGFQDQFGGPKGKKYKAKTFKKYLMSIQAQTMDQQYHLLEEEFVRYKGSEEQIDDILVIGFRV